MQATVVLRHVLRIPESRDGASQAKDVKLHLENNSGTSSNIEPFLSRSGSRSVQVEFRKSCLADLLTLPAASTVLAFLTHPVSLDTDRAKQCSTKHRTEPHVPTSSSTIHAITPRRAILTSSFVEIGSFLRPVVQNLLLTRKRRIKAPNNNDLFLRILVRKTQGP